MSPRLLRFYIKVIPPSDTMPVMSAGHRRKSMKPVLKQDHCPDIGPTVQRDESQRAQYLSGHCTKSGNFKKRSRYPKAGHLPYKSPTLVPILSHSNYVYTLTTVLS
jgi:hypothetical protein